MASGCTGAAALNLRADVCASLVKTCYQAWGGIGQGWNRTRLAHQTVEANRSGPSRCPFDREGLAIGESSGGCGPRIPQYQFPLLAVITEPIDLYQAMSERKIMIDALRGLVGVQLSASIDSIDYPHADAQFIDVLSASSP